MRGYMRQRGGAWELRVYVGRDAVTRREHYATRLLTAGVDVRTVAGRLGHRNAATTFKVYSHFVPEADRQAAEVLARLLDAERR
jgi:integrase